MTTVKQPKSLNARFVETVNLPGRYGDGHGGHGLSLNVKPMSNGRMSKSWVQRIRIAGRATNIGLGPYPIVTLAEARRKAVKNRRSIAQGLDPRGGGVPTFREALERVLDVQRPNWRNPKSEKQWRVAQGHRNDNPAGDAIGAALPNNGVRRKHQRALPHAEVGLALRKVAATDAWPATEAAYARSDLVDRSAGSWMPGPTICPTTGRAWCRSTDRIQRWLKASIEADPAATARQAWFDNLTTEPDALSFILPIAIKQSETEPWWYDTLIALVQRNRQSPEWEQNPELPSLLLNWCLGVAVGDIVPPKRRGRPANPIRDMLICTAVDAYTDPKQGAQTCSLSEAYGLVADATGVDDSVVRKIWQHSQAGEKTK